MSKRTPQRRAATSKPPAALLGAALRDLNEGVFIAERRLLAEGLRIVYVNEAFCRMTGLSAAELTGRTHGFLHIAHADLVPLRRWHARLMTAKPLSGQGYLSHKSHGTVYAAWTYSVLRNARGRVTHIVGSYRDLTGQRKLQEELTHSQRLDAVGRLAGGVAHDFNNLLSIINGYCEILTDTVGDNMKARKEVAEIHEAGQKATTLVRQLLAFSRRQAMTPKVINLNRLVRDNADILNRLLKPDKSLVLSLSEDLSNVRADPAQIQQVVLNLSMNARDALRPGGQVTISTANREVRAGKSRRLNDLPPGRYVLLAVSDNGSGMDAKTQDHLFEPFFTTKEEGQGTGLGLALVYGVVQQSGGFIFVHSAPNVGSTFEIFLPEVREPAAAPEGSLPPLPITRGRETLLVVEDDDVVRKMVAGILTADGYQVIATKSPAEGLHEVRKLAKPIHVVCVDHSDRAGDGERLIRELMTSQPALRVVCTSNQDTPPLSTLATSSQTCLPKPFALSALLKAVRALLDAA
jgi:two-component system cell cycle sensor histidine kinase/response regulator CckA